MGLINLPAYNNNGLPFKIHLNLNECLPSI